MPEFRQRALAGVHPGSVFGGSIRALPAQSMKQTIRQDRFSQPALPVAANLTHDKRSVGCSY